MKTMSGAIMLSTAPTASGSILSPIFPFLSGCEIVRGMGAQPSKADMIFKALFVGAFWLVGFGTIALQCLGFLFDGNWTSVSLVAVGAMFSSNPWWDNPSTWIGLHWLLSKVPMSLTAIAIGWFILVADD